MNQDLLSMAEDCRREQKEGVRKLQSKEDYYPGCSFRDDLAKLCISDWLVEEILIEREIEEEGRNENQKIR